MSKKILVPVFPSEWFYDACIRAADIVAQEGGIVTFAFCRVRPPESAYADDGDGRPGELDISTNAGDYDGKDLEAWREKQIAALEEARQLLYQRGVGDGQPLCVDRAAGVSARHRRNARDDGARVNVVPMKPAAPG